MRKIHLFKSKDDYTKELTNDNVINIIGTKGSGKTTTSLKYIKDNKYIVVNCDRLLELPSNEEIDKELSKIRKYLKDKYNTIEVKDFKKYYNDIIEYISNKKKIAIIEGNVIQNLKEEDLKGTLIIKRTAVVKSFIRAVKRDYKNKYFMDKEKEMHRFFYKITRLHKTIKRRTKIFKQAKDLERYM